MRLFDLHCDTITECCTRELPLKENRELHLSLERGKPYYPWVQCFAVWMPDELRGEKAVAYFDRIAAYFRKEMEANQQNITFCITSADIDKSEKQRKAAAILTVEGGSVLAGDLSRVAFLRNHGVRCLTLTWNGACEIGDGVMVPNAKGLTTFGRQVIPELEQNGIIVDVSHASEPLFYDVAELARKPFIATHSNAKAVCNHPRNLTDEQFKIIRDRGGLVGLNFYGAFLREDGTANFDDAFRHVYHFLSLGGEKTLAIGSDFDGAEMMDQMDGIEKVEALAEHFYKRGLKETLIDRIFYQNAKEFLDFL